MRVVREGVPYLPEAVDITLLHEPFCRLALLSHEYAWNCVAHFLDIEFVSGRG